MFLIIRAGDYNSYKFHPNIYFHPNVCDDGWVTLWENHSGAKLEWEMAREDYGVEVAEAEAKGEKVEENVVNPAGDKKVFSFFPWFSTRAEVLG
jgi:hypothetical protein